MKNSNLVEPNIFDLFGSLGFDVSLQADDASAMVSEVSVDSVDSSEVSLDTIEDYLHREEIITTLAKKRFQNELKGVEFSDIEEKLYSLKMPDLSELSNGKKRLSAGHVFVQKIGTSIVRPILRAMKEPFSEDDGVLTLKQLVDARYGFELAKTDVSLSHIGRTAMKAEGEEMIQLTLCEDGFEPLVIYGTKMSSHPANRRNTLFKDGCQVADLAFVIAWLIVLSQVQQEAKVQQALDESQKAENVLYTNFQKMKNELQNELIYDIKICVAHELALVGKEKSEIEKFSFSDIEFCYCSSSHLNPAILKKIGERANLKNFKTQKSLQEYYFQQLRSEHAVYRLQNRNQFHVLGAIAMEENWINYHELLVYHNDKLAFPYPYISSSHTVAGVFANLFDMIMKERGSKMRTAKYLKKLTSDYAESYQNKKNIPDKTVNAMRESGFNTHFGYVEFDESVDLDKVEIVRKEFDAVWEKYLSFVDSTKNALRFRLLGNHNAIGLYYPHIKCLCVDVRYPHSFLHEYGHLIDYEYGHLSEENSFYKVRVLYKKYLTEGIEEGSAAFKQLHGNTKYNLDYYLEATEIFARSFELYMAKVKGVKNSLLPETFGWEYPNDSTFLNAVEEYFDRMFLILSKSKAA